MSYSCESCGYRSAKWMGFCPQCGRSGPLDEVADLPRSGRSKAARRGPAPVAAQLNESAQLERRTSGMGEVDRVLGGGLVPGSVVLVGGEPGVGKSTLLLQLAGSIANDGGRVLVCSAEESAQQVAMRAERVGVIADGVLVLAEDDVDAAIAAADEASPDLLIIDSIQTVGVTDLDSAPGSVTQVRESASRLVRYAKERGVATILVGHVTKDGGLAGPKLLEHMVDVVLSLEGDPDRGFRALRSFKNRFGATHTVALFDMRNEGMVEVEDPSEAFLSEWQSDVPGTVVFPAVEGRRSVLVEIQALVTSSSQVQPRRSVRGVAPSRVHQILAVLDRHCGIPLADHEVYVNVVGGWTLDEPACDLPVALALASSRMDLPLGSVAAWGEIGLAGEVRPVPFEARRREEAGRLKIGTVVAPSHGQRLSRALIEAGLVSSSSP
ncbi:MAG: DNA repair protein RadA [Acidimicrobiia bacterium]